MTAPQNVISLVHTNRTLASANGKTVKIIVNKRDEITYASRDALTLLTGVTVKFHATADEVRAALPKHKIVVVRWSAAPQALKDATEQARATLKASKSLPEQRTA